MKKTLSILLIVICLLKTFDYYSQSNRYYPQKMKFSCGKFDTIYVSIAHDSTFDVHYLTVSCTKHNHTEWKSITFGFVDGTMLEVFQDGGWTITDPKLLSAVEFDFISFDEAYFSSACIQVRTKDYFTKYFSMVQK